MIVLFSLLRIPTIGFWSAAVVLIATAPGCLVIAGHNRRVAAQA